MQKLHDIARQYFGPDYRPNASAEERGTVLDMVDRSAALAGLLSNMQEAGADISRYGDDEWEELLQGYLGVTDEELFDYLEQVASWGVVDNG